MYSASILRPLSNLQFIARAVKQREFSTQTRVASFSRFSKCYSILIHSQFISSGKGEKNWDSHKTEFDVCFSAVNCSIGSVGEYELTFYILGWLFFIRKALFMDNKTLFVSKRLIRWGRAQICNKSAWVTESFLSLPFSKQQNEMWRSGNKVWVVALKSKR